MLQRKQVSELRCHEMGEGDLLQYKPLMMFAKKEEKKRERERFQVCLLWFKMASNCAKDWSPP